jgi:hypothetical protein
VGQLKKLLPTTKHVNRKQKVIILFFSFKITQINNINKLTFRANNHWHFSFALIDFLFSIMNIIMEIAEESIRDSIQQTRQSRVSRHHQSYGTITHPRNKRSQIIKTAYRQHKPAESHNIFLAGSHYRR